MEKIGVKTIQMQNGTNVEFDVYPCNCKIGDTIWFDDTIPNEDGSPVLTHDYVRGKVTSIAPEHWWIYDNGEKELGYVTIKVEDDDLYDGQNFAVAFKNIIYEDPTEILIAESMKLLESCKRLDKEMAEMNKDIDFLLNEYKTNKRYFRQEPGRCTVEDVIKTVYEFAWASSRNYHTNE